MNPTRRTIFSILVLVGLFLTILDGWVFHARGAWAVIPGCVVIALAPWLWIKGLRSAGKGWRRAIFLAAFAAPMISFGLSFNTGAHDAYDGFVDGWNDASSEHAKPTHEQLNQPPQPRFDSPNPFPVLPPGTGLVSWVLLTGLLMGVLDRLERRQAEAERQAELAKEARTQALAAKLAPHFTFNTLNTLHAQIEVDPKGAQATTERLAQLFRQVIAASDQLTIPLRQELAFVEAYLGIEQARLGERLRVNVEIPEDLEAAKVPPLSLQVLVENAVKHGVAPLEAGGEIRIGAEKKEGFLHLWVEDPGPGISTQRGTGTALETLRQRLESPVDLELGMVEGRHRVSFRWRMA